MKNMKKHLKFLNNERGQSMVEFAVAVPVFILFFNCILYLGEIYIVKHQTITAARYVSWACARPISPDCVSNIMSMNFKIQNYFFIDYFNALTLAETAYWGDPFPILTVLNTPFRDPTSGSIPGMMSGIAEQFVSYAMGGMSTSYSQTWVKMKVPVSDGIANLDPTGTLSDIWINSEHLVNSNAWSGYETDIHDTWGILRGNVMNIFNLGP